MGQLRKYTLYVPGILGLTPRAKVDDDFAKLLFSFAILESFGQHQDFQ